MTAAMAMPGNTAETFLVHFFGTGLADDRYVVERYRARADGDIVPAPAEALAAKGRRKVKRTTATRASVAVLPSNRTTLIPLFARSDPSAYLFGRLGILNACTERHRSLAGSSFCRNK